jgi:fructoselysine/glucoselysine PTS system EIIB component
MARARAAAFRAKRFRKDNDVIKLFRIDHRLLHGQVGFSWVRSIGADCILIADDDSATDSLKLATLRLAKPQGIKLVVKTVEDSIKAITSGVTDKYKLFIVTGSVADAKRICDAIPEIKSVNLGGIKKREGTRQVSQAIFLLPEEEDMLHELAGRGIELEIRQVPTETKTIYA